MEEQLAKKSKVDVKYYDVTIRFKLNGTIFELNASKHVLSTYIPFFDHLLNFTTSSKETRCNQIEIEYHRIET